MSRSSASDLGKEAETRNINQHSNIDHDLTTGQKELIEAAEPPFTERESDDKDEQDSNDLERVATKASSKPSVNNIKSVPNGGLWAWLQVVSSFFLFMVRRGRPAPQIRSRNEKC